MKTMTRVTVAALILAAAGNAYASTSVLDARQDRQERRIDQGVASGELTQVEAARLDARQRHIRNAEYRAKADGVVTVRERARLQSKQNRASAAIARQKHDRQDRRW